MKRKSLILLLLCIVICSASVMTGCKKKNEAWAFSHEQEKAVMTFYADGTASYDGKSYKSYEVTDDHILFTAKDGSVTSVRYYDGKDYDGQERRYIYRKAYYKLIPDMLVGDSPIVGLWEGTNGNEGLSFQFTAKGTFYEDETLPGYYFVNDDGSILLDYDGYLSSTLIYYSIDGDLLTIDYPWAMVKMP